MTSHRILIVYGTSYGHTAKVAARMKEVLAADGFGVTTFDAAALPVELDPLAFDGVIVAASVISGRHQRAVVRFVMRHLEILNWLPSAFVSVSGSAASSDPKRRNDARVLMESFLDGLAWHPDLMTPLGGEYAFTRYSRLLRWIMKRITTKSGGPTDTTRDHDLTDWAHVDYLARRFTHLVDPVTFTTPGALESRQLTATDSRPGRRDIC